MRKPLQRIITALVTAGVDARRAELSRRELNRAGGKRDDERKASRPAPIEVLRCD